MAAESAPADEGARARHLWHNLAEHVEKTAAAHHRCLRYGDDSPDGPVDSPVEVACAAGGAPRGAYQALRPLARWSDAWAAALGEEGVNPVP